MTTTTYLELKWTISRARETEGYNVLTLTDTTAGRNHDHARFRVLGGGYDMVGSVFGEWLQANYADELRAIADRAHGQYQQRLATAADPADGPAMLWDRTQNDDGLYGMTCNRSPKMTRTWVTLDGGCGLESMRRIAEAIGLTIQATLDRRGNYTGFIVTDGARS